MDIKSLVLKGYFPEELPPVFQTEDLSSISDIILKALDTLDPIGKRPLLSKSTPYSAPKIKGYRRPLSIPNPLHFVRLANTVVENWSDITLHCQKSTLSLSKLELKADSQRSLLKPSIDNIIKERILRSEGHRYLLKIDIARFYSSIYTHSIPWAIHTKRVSKTKRKRAELWGNAIDEDCRKIQDGQTVGIPIGPDTSRIISELLLSTIDEELQKKVPNLCGIRFVDDYYLYFKSYNDAEIARAALQKLLKDFELELNSGKEKIVELPEIIENIWLHELREFRFRNEWKKQRKDLIAFFDKAFTFAKKYPEDFVLTYAMAKLRATVFDRRNIAILQSFIINSLIVEPKILPYIAQTLIAYQQKGYKLNLDSLRRALEEFIEFHHSLSNDFEITWSLWLLKSLNIKVSDETSKLLSDSTNPIVILTALDLYHSGFLSKSLKVANWTSHFTTDNLYTENWLLAYEAFIQGWAAPKADYISKDPFFKILKDNKISFYHPDRVLDMSKVKVTLATFYLGELADDEVFDEKSVFQSKKPDMEYTSEKKKLDELITDLPF